MQKASISARYTRFAAAAVCSNEVVQCFLYAIFHPPLMFDTERKTGVWHKRCTRNANEWNNSAKAQNMASARKKSPPYFTGVSGAGLLRTPWTRQVVVLIKWKSRDSPAPGRCRLALFTRQILQLAGCGSQQTSKTIGHTYTHIL